MTKLNGKNIVTRGASQGLGPVLALRFAREGAAGLVIAAGARRSTQQRSAIRLTKIGSSRAVRFSIKC
jgi:NAD(P)-dependent dehydrogenase (short-subunit alcohol dehydrogenase family)